MNNLLFARTATKDTSLQEFMERHLLTANFVTICQEMGIETLGEMLAHHYKHFRFKGYSQAGSQEEIRIHEFCASFAHLLETIGLPKMAPDLDKVKFESYLRQASKLIDGLPLMVMRYLQFGSQLKFYQDYVQGEKSFHFFDTSSPSIFPHLQELRMRLRVIANELVGKGVAYEFDELVDTCVSEYGCEKKDLEVFRKPTESGNFPLFGFVSYLLEEGYLLSSNDMQLAKHGLAWIGGYEVFSEFELMRLAGIGDALLNKKMGKLPKLIQDKLAPLAAHRSYIQQQSRYSFDNTAALFHVSEETAAQLNHAEEANMAPSLYTLIVNTFLMPERLPLIFSTPWIKNYYLIEKDTNEAFNVCALFNKHGKSLYSNFTNKNYKEVKRLSHFFVRLNTVQMIPIAEEMVFKILEDSYNKVLASVNLGSNGKPSEPMRNRSSTNKSSVEMYVHPQAPQILKVKNKVNLDEPPFGFYEHLETLKRESQTS